MKLNTLFIITAIVAVVFGLAFIFFAGQVYSLYGVESNSLLNYMWELFGAALLAVGLIAWRSRNAADSDSRRAIIFSFFIADAVGFVIALVGQLNNVVNALGWSTVAIYFLLSLGFGYFQFSKQVSAQS